MKSFGFAFAFTFLHEEVRMPRYSLSLPSRHSNAKAHRGATVTISGAEVGQNDALARTSRDEA